MMVMTGPKVSSFAIRIECVTSASTVGWKKSGVRSAPFKVPLELPEGSQTPTRPPLTSCGNSPTRNAETQINVNDERCGWAVRIKLPLVRMQ